MIVPNGRLRFPIAGGGAADVDPATGHAVKAGVAWDGGVPCQFVWYDVNYLTVSRGERYTSARWLVYIDMPCAPRRGLCRVERGDMGVIVEAEIQAWEELVAVQQVRIVL